MDKYSDARDHEEVALNCNKLTLYALGKIKIYSSIQVYRRVFRLNNDC